MSNCQSGCFESCSSRGLAGLFIAVVLVGSVVVAAAVGVVLWIVGVV